LKKRLRGRGMLVAALAVWLASAGPALAAITGPRIYDDGTNWANPEGVTVPDGELTFPDLGSRQFESATVSFSGRLSDGRNFTISLVRWAYGFFGGWNLYVLVAGSEPPVFSRNYAVNGREVQLARDRLSIRFGDNLIEGRNRLYRVRLNLEGFACDLELHGLLPPWKPGDGVASLSADGSAYVHDLVPAPWATLAGWMSVEGSREAVEGECRGGLSKTSLPPDKVSTPVYALQGFSPSGVDPEDRWILTLSDAALSRAYGAGHQSTLTLAHDGRWVLTTGRLELRDLEMARGGEDPVAYPSRIAVSAADRGYILQGEYRVEQTYEVFDVFGDLSPFLRAVASLFVKDPTIVQTAGVFRGRLQLPDGQSESLSLAATLEYTLVK
jgi:hypothetical protein